MMFFLRGAAVAAAMFVLADRVSAQRPDASASGIPSLLPRMATPAGMCRSVYPDAVLRSGVTGVTVAEFDVRADGQVQSSRVIKSAGDMREHKMLDRAFVHAVTMCGSHPAIDAAGQPARSAVQLAFTYTLD